jgi:hypothetical protein
MDMGGSRKEVLVKREGEGNNMSEPTYQTFSAATAIVKVRITLLRQELRRVEYGGVHSQWQHFSIRRLVGALDTVDAALNRGR